MMPACAGTPITFTATVNGIGGIPGYQWQVNGSSAGSNSSTFTAGNLNSNDIVTCSVNSSGAACLLSITSDPITVTINPVPAVSFSGNLTVNTGKSVQLQPIISGGNIQSYTWSPATGLSDPNIADPVASPLVSTTYTLTVTSVNGCSDSATVKVAVVSKLVIPNTFTPNGDGINDFWDISNLMYYPDCTVNIYNRWGFAVYQSKGYGKPWDGTYKGSPLPAGTYYYVIDIKNNTAPLAGYVTVIR
jgi:gliding motility-associated-like protein